MQCMTQAVQETSEQLHLHVVPAARLPSAARPQVIATGFTLLVTVPEDVEEVGFTGRFVAASISLLPSRHRLSAAAHRALLNGLQRVHLSFTLGTNERDCITSGVLLSSVRTLDLAEPRQVSDVSLLLACLYAQDQALLPPEEQQRGGRPEDALVMAEGLTHSGLVQLRSLLRDPTYVEASARTLARVLLDFETPRQVLQDLVDRWSSRFSGDASAAAAAAQAEAAASEAEEHAAAQPPGAAESEAVLMAAQAAATAASAQARAAAQHRWALRAEAILAYHVLELLRRRGLGEAVGEWIAMSLGNLMHATDCERVLACLFAAAAPGGETNTTRSLLPYVAWGGGSGGEAEGRGESGADAGAGAGSIGGGRGSAPLAPELLWVAGLRFFASETMSESTRTAVVSMLSSSRVASLQALAEACLAWHAAHGPSSLPSSVGLGGGGGFFGGSMASSLSGSVDVSAGRRYSGGGPRFSIGGDGSSLGGSSSLA
jgi:hypothetical protein